MININKARNSLNDLKPFIIGVFKNSTGGTYELVLHYNKMYGTVDTIHITQFGAIQQHYERPINYGQLELFEDNKKMDEVLVNPMEWVEIINKFK